MIKEFQEKNRKVIVSPIRIDLLFVFMQCSVLLKLIVFQKIIGMELKRKGYALYVFIFNKKKNEGRERNTRTGFIYKDDVSISGSNPS